jgi:hypothetical protein
MPGKDDNPNLLEVIVHQPNQDTPWYALNKPTWGDLFIGLSLIAGAITWWLNRTKERITAEAATEQRREELKWRRTQFVFEQAELFETDAHLSKAIKLITGDDDTHNIQHILGDHDKPGLSKYGNERHNMEKLFSLLERLAYAVEDDVLTLKELATFEWYYKEILRNSILNNYCTTYFPAVLRIACSLREISEKPEQRDLSGR